MSFRRPWLFAVIDLPVTPEQRSSPWSYRTRQERRQQARSLLRDKLTRLEAGDQSGIDGQDQGMAMTADDPTERFVAFGQELLIITHNLGQKC
jgi:hypothetical protein